MPYISSAEIAQKRAAIKQAFPNWKFSITREHHSGIRIQILEADIILTDKKYCDINTFYIGTHFKDEAKDAIEKIYQIAAKGVREFVNDVDYGSVPTFYVWMNIGGGYDKPFKFIHGAITIKLKNEKA